MLILNIISATGENVGDMALWGEPMGLQIWYHPPGETCLPNSSKIFKRYLLKISFAKGQDDK